MSRFCALGLIWACSCRAGGVYAPELLEVTPRDVRGAPAPDISEDQMRALAGMVRRSLTSKRAPRASQVAALLSPGVSNEQCRVHVTVRDRGVILARGGSRYLPLDDALTEAVRETLRSIAPKRASLKGRWNELTVECELTGPAEYVPFAGAGRLPFQAYFETGVHGYGLLSGSRWWEVRPSQVISGGWGSHRDPSLVIVAEMMEADTRSGGTMLDPPKAHRFRSTHWWQPRADAPAIALVRGLAPVPPQAVSAAKLDTMIERLGDYLMRRQEVEGLFAYEYVLSADEYTHGNNWVRQAGATWALAVYADYSKHGIALEAARRAVNVWIRTITPLEDVLGGGFIDTGTGKNKLGTTAIVLLALTEPPFIEQHEAQRDLLVTAILSVQQDDGRFLPNFPPAELRGSQYYYPGQALLGLARVYGFTGDERLADAFARAHRFYVSFFEESGSPAFVPWQVQAHALMYQLTGRREYADFALHMSDWLARRLIDENDTVWPDLYGGIANADPRRAGISTASYLEGFADVLELARRLGDAERAERYEHVVRASARFVMQLIVKPEETFFHVRPDQSTWGVRPALYDGRLRIDHVQHALAALMKTRTVLFGKPPGFRSPGD